ncbi:hypothetical protein CHUAL_001309 [Chamberlinius hualienensis]
MGKVSVSFEANPRGELWRKDESGVGFQMLTKMGWSIGKGLGRLENGMAEPIAVRLKEDVKGVGYKDNSDQWVENLNQFDQLLANLNKEFPADKETRKVTETLEEKSRKSKRRVHYQKFVRGKDTSRYSVEDMEAILGKRANKSKKVKVEKNTTESQFKTSSCNMHEYLAKKMQERKAKLLNGGFLAEERTEDVEPVAEERTEDVEPVAEEGKKKKEKKKRKQDDNDEVEETSENSKKRRKLPENELECEDNVAKRSKKCKKNKKKREDID